VDLNDVNQSLSSDLEQKIGSDLYWV